MRAVSSVALIWFARLREARCRRARVGCSGVLSTADAPPPLAPTPALRPPRHRVSPRAIRYWTARAGAGWALVVIAEAVWLVVLAGERKWPLIALAVTLVLAAAHLTVMPRWRYAVHRWEAAPDAVSTQSGWFDQE